jgi:hypothetical protein
MCEELAVIYALWEKMNYYSMEIICKLFDSQVWSSPNTDTQNSAETCNRQMEYSL